ncbi:condensin subunit ScpA [Amphibacillus marinus]|uniref:Segregation and condensation protein A n=1 Tax=Amphibacillus marinus TaxID=872970 RepID=A0A1H8GC44_9BACI|nr:segregation/condensation protein A [Amphibacillus marinus]SEN41314.1 condensin subunit ScpA [Amphibacillus marinus]
MIESYNVRVDGFEGPLDLLLHLVNRYEIDIYNIPVSTITAQYLQYIHTMQQLELNMASEYLVMAATLLAIKSAMLLPNQELDEDTDYDENDPRDELIARLIEYRKYKEAATELKDREGEEKNSYTRAPEKIAAEQKDSIQPIAGSGSIYDMLAAMQNVFNRKKWNRPMETTIERVEIPIKQRMEQVLLIVEQSDKGVAFDDLFPYPSKTHIVVTFMAMLELMKERLVYCQQDRTFDRLVLHRWES